MFIVLISGLPGSGKSYFGRKLSRELKANYLNRDLVRKELFVNPVYSKLEKKVLYSEFIRLTEDFISQSEPLIIDSTFYKATLRNSIKKIARKHQRQLLIIEVFAREELIMQRLEEDRVDSDSNFELFKIIRSLFEPISEPHLKIESRADNIDQMLQIALKEIKSLQNSQKNN